MIKFILEEGVELPEYKTEEAAGMDVIANSIKKCFKGDKEVSKEKLEKMKQGFKDRGYIKLRPFERILFGTGLTVADMDKSLEAQVRPRSGQSLKQGIIITNSPGTIDSDYRGEIGIILQNPSPFLTTIEKGQRIAQLVFSEVTKVVPVIYKAGIDSYSETERGSGSFGSTGTKN